MKYFKLTTVLTLLFVLLSSYKTADNAPNNWIKADDFKYAGQQPIKGHLTKAVLYNGEVIPSIELPIVEIIASRSTQKFQKAIIVEGKIYPVVTLDEVTIRPNL